VNEPHPIAEYELDEEQLLSATTTEVAEARAHLTDAESLLSRFKPDASTCIERARTCLAVALARITNDEIVLEQLDAIRLSLNEAHAACDAAHAHVRLYDMQPDDKRAKSHAEKATQSARAATHRALALLLEQSG